MLEIYRPPRPISFDSEVERHDRVDERPGVGVAGVRGERGLAGQSRYVL